jgi:Ca2+-transporting ATPase
MPDELIKQGLTTEQAKALQLKYGANLLPEKKPPSNLTIFISQLKNPLIYILLISGLVTFFIGDYSDAFIILITVLINTVLGYVQERKASNALYALKHYISAQTIVFRDGQRLTINTSELVPGDVVVLSQGAKIPADGILLDANRLYLDESILTGESSPVEKKIGESVSMGTTIAAGLAVMKVESIGASTQMGAIALQIQGKENDTPLQVQIKGFSRQLIIVVSVLVVIVLIVGLIYGLTLRDIFLTSVALTVSSIPEGLIVSLTVVLAIGMQKILRRKALVRKLSAAETLGGVTVICVDKTGTITAGKMEVVKTEGDEIHLAEQMLIANDLDDPILITAQAWAQTVLPKFSKIPERLDSIPFSSKERFFISLNRTSSSANKIFVNGAPEIVLDWTTLKSSEKKAVRSKIDQLTGLGYRLIGLAQKNVSSRKLNLKTSDAKGDLTWVGMIAFSDPVRPSVKDALVKAQSAGLRTIVITGDYAKTSQFILSSLGIHLTKSEIMEGDELKHLTVEQLAQKVGEIKLFARTTPDQKLIIVEALKKNREVVAMMGDGVNDAPALRAADIGIAVGEATDVSKESADLVILDSNFSTIISAIEEGRGIFENIRKIILYLMSDAFTEIIVVLGSIILGFPPALIAVQILWINLGSDGLPNLSLTIDPIRKNIMTEPPRKVGEKLVSSWMIILIAVISLTAGLLALGAFVYTYQTTGDLVLARSVTFITLGFDTLVYVFSVRTLMIPFWRSNVFANKWLLGAVVVGFILQILPFTSSTLRAFFGLTILTPIYWLAGIAAAILMFILVEIFKLIYHPRTTRTLPQPL